MLFKTKYIRTKTSLHIIKKQQLTAQNAIKIQLILIQKIPLLKINSPHNKQHIKITK
jgi:hypothetical protein